MARFKQIMTYVLLMVIFAVFTSYIVKIGISNTYKTIEGEVVSFSPEITISESKATDVNGYLRGNIKNDSENDIEKIVLKLDVYSRVDTNLGTEYFEVLNLKAGEDRAFRIEYNYNDVDHYAITCVSEEEE